MAKGGLAIVIGPAKSKDKAEPDDETEDDGEDLAADYATEAWDAAKDNDREAFDAAIKGMARCYAKNEDDADDMED